MPEIVPPQVRLIAWTHFEAPDDVPWSTDADGGQALAEFAGRACYQSWNKPNPATATNAGYLAHILEVGHLSVLEHGVGDLLPHRRLPLVHPRADPAPALLVLAAVPALRARSGTRRWSSPTSSPTTRSCTRRSSRRPRPASGRTPSCWRAWSRSSPTSPTPTLRRKQARQAARAVLPNATETRIVVTGNYRAWRHFIAMRATEHADVEIRELAIECLRQLQGVAPERVRRLHDLHAARRHRGRGQPVRGVLGALTGEADRTDLVVR